MKISKETRIEYEKILTYKGAPELFEFVLNSAVTIKKAGKEPDLIYLSESEGFFSLYRQSGVENYFIIGGILRRAAHKLYRERLKEGLPIDRRFLNRIK